MAPQPFARFPTISSNLPGSSLCRVLFSQTIYPFEALTPPHNTWYADGMVKNLLYVPFWLCEQIQLDQKLLAIIKRDFFQPTTAFDDLKRAQQLHSAIVSGAKEAHVDLTQLETKLVEFYFLVKDVELKFPDHVVTFEWFDTFYHRPALNLAKSWRLEQSHLVFQIGILYSHKAHAENLHSDDGLKIACALFQMAAGCFQFLLDAKNGVLSLDTNVVACLRSLMVSQAQELIWRKAVRGMSMKDSVIARLSMKVADYYGEAIRYSEQASLIKQDWINHLHVKHFHFIAAAYYRMSVHALDTFEYGAQVAYLRTALQLCKGAMKHQQCVADVVVTDLKGLMLTVEDTLRAAEKDNDLVYLKPVPEMTDLPSISGVSMVEPKTPTFLVKRDGHYPPAFAKLMPFAVVQVSQAFRERQEAYILASFHDPLHALTRMLRQFLAERQLPASLDTLQVLEEIPDSIVKHAQEIMSIGGTRIIEIYMDEISLLAANSRALVNECEERLRLERQEDDIMREREGIDRWNRTPSQISSAEHWAKVEKMHDYLAQGQASDMLLGETYGFIKDSLDVYCGGQKKLLKFIPGVSQIQLDPAGDTSALELRELLDEVSKLETKRERFEKSINLKSRNHSILSVVIDAYKRAPERFLNEKGKIDQAKFEPVYETHIAYFNTDLAYLVQLKEQQMMLEVKIDAASQKFDRFRERTLTKAQVKRLAALNRLENDYVKYLELVQNLNDALKFYNTFLGRANVVLQEFDAYLKERREEARELAIAIQDQRNFEGIEQSMTRNPSNIAAPKPRLQKDGLWDPSKGIRFS